MGHKLQAVIGRNCASFLIDMAELEKAGAIETDDRLETNVESPNELDITPGAADELAAYLMRQCSEERELKSSHVNSKQYFGFQHEPFGFAPDAHCLYVSRGHEEALSALRRGFSSNRGYTALIAPPGLGKTTLLLHFLEEIKQSAQTVFLFDIDSHCEPGDFVGQILRRIGITPAQNSYEMHEQFNAALAKAGVANRKLVLVVDEAQNLSDAIIERIRLLSNFDISGSNLHVIFAGQPILYDRLMSPAMEQFSHRVSTIYQIDPLMRDEVVPYIEFRISEAGYQGAPLFTPEALKLITDACDGIPRTINELCFNALSLCQQQQRKQVDGELMSQVLGDQHVRPAENTPVVLQDQAKADDWTAFPTDREELRAQGLRATELKASEQRAERFYDGDPYGPPKHLFEYDEPTSGRMIPWLLVGLLIVACVVGVLKFTGNLDWATKSLSGQWAKLSSSSSAKLAAQPSSSSPETQQTASAPAQTDSTPQNLQEPVPTSAPVNESAVPATPSAANGVDIATQPAPSSPLTGDVSDQIAPAAPLPKTSTSKVRRESVSRTAPARRALDIAQRPTTPREAAISAPYSGPPIVQIALFNSVEDSSALVKALYQRGYAVKVARNPIDSMIHVQIGPFSSLGEADQMRSRLIADGYNAIIRP